ncbi:unnamed protein product [Schistosoma margrebowiei]|uniref:Small subunit rRNA processing protein n=1 Tax=Schistosoma margrebowiei TaxID=48269 RepID=A0A183LQK1_9TREM|nr:unnamed protein product [Schistosoma margrebowiei]VDO69311.1 unnamed protein product [Schistosoma margrebowiei]
MNLHGSLDRIQGRKDKHSATNNKRARADKFKAQAEYTESNKQVKRITRDDKQKYMEELATTMEKAAREGNMEQLYDTTKKLARRYNKPEKPVKNKEGTTITAIQEQGN